jgi:hypothetical protein
MMAEDDAGEPAVPHAADAARRRRAVEDERLARALRENLLKRKIQARARIETEPSG